LNGYKRQGNPEALATFFISSSIFATANSDLLKTYSILSMNENPESNHFETQAVRIQAERSEFREHSVPLYLTSSFAFEDAEQARALFADEIPGNIYTRFSNPNNTELIDKLCALEGTEDGIATASGMAAMFTSMAALLKSGDHILASRSVFGSTHQILTQLFPRWGITHTYADIDKPETWESLIQPNTKMIFVETPSNPALDIIDLEWLGKLAARHNLILNVDNCFATPYLQQPAKFGAHLVTHSATKFIDGQGRVIGGAILGKKEIIKEIRFFARHTGPSMSPFNAWTLSKSLETLAVRMEKHSDNAHKLAIYLESHPKVERVSYPFLPSHPQYELAKKQMRTGGAMVSFIVKGGIDKGRQFLNSLKMISLAANLGDTRTIATHPASTTHSKLTDDDRAAVGILPGLIRVSVGLEHMDDIIADIDQALNC
jgi:O-succinylhomoserine sulfhydrylase